MLPTCINIFDFNKLFGLDTHAVCVHFLIVMYSLYFFGVKRCYLCIHEHVRPKLLLQKHICDISFLGRN